VATVSCVIPTHRRVDFLREALASITAQDIVPFEVIVVSDVADEESAAVCASVAECCGLPVRYLGESPGHSGASASRNRGAAAARGYYVAFLDDDDVWRPGYLRHALAVRQAEGADMVVTWIEMFMGTSVKAGPHIMPGLPPAAVVAANPGATGSNMLLTRESFERTGGFDETLRMRNDTDFFYRFLKGGGSYAVSPQPLVGQRKHESGQLTGHSVARAEAIEAYVRKHRSDLRLLDRRRLAFYIHRIRSHAAPRRSSRLLHAGLALLSYSPSQFVVDRRNSRDVAYYTVPSIAE
jgi:GT2 family glycosyltransferase